MFIFLKEEVRLRLFVMLCLVKKSNISDSFPQKPKESESLEHDFAITYNTQKTPFNLIPIIIVLTEFEYAQHRHLYSIFFLLPFGHLQTHARNCQAIYTSSASCNI
jgi:hypothetical protein